MKSVFFIKTQKSRYLKNETLFFLQIKKLITHQGLIYGKKNSFVVEVIFKPGFLYYCTISKYFTTEYAYWVKILLKNQSLIQRCHTMKYFRFEIEARHPHRHRA